MAVSKKFIDLTLCVALGLCMSGCDNKSKICPAVKPILETERLLIRPFVFEDDQAVLDLFADGGAPHLTQYGPLDIDYARGFLRHTISGYQKDGLGLWAVIDKTTGKLIGDCGLHKAKIGEHEEAVELAYRIHKTLWGKGFATEAAKAVLSYAFDVLNLPEVVSCIAYDNARSVRVAEKIGMTYWKEGIFMGKPCLVYRKMNEK